MKKIVILILLSVVVGIAFLFYQNYQEKQFKSDFKRNFESMPALLNPELNKMNDKFMDAEFMAIYPTMIFYLDMNFFKGTTLPPEAKKSITNQGRMICQTMFAKLNQQFNVTSNRETKMVLDLLQSEKITAEIKIRNAFGQDLYTEKQLLSSCPEYSTAVYNLNQ